MEQTEQAKSEDSLQTSSWNDYLIEVLWLLLASETCWLQKRSPCWLAATGSKDQTNLVPTVCVSFNDRMLFVSCIKVHQRLRWFRLIYSISYLKMMQFVGSYNWSFFHVWGVPSNDRSAWLVPYMRGASPNGLSFNSAEMKNIHAG